MWLGFIVASILITLMPGPSMLVVIMNTLQRGVSAGILSSFGVVVADALLLILTLSGIGALLYSSALAFTLVKWCGVAYLVYLGIRQLLSSNSVNSSENENGSERLATSTPGSFVQGFATTMLNPKIISFFIAFFPQFLDPELPAIPQLLMLGPVFLLIVFVILVMYTMLAKAARVFLSSPRGQLCVQKLSGGMLIGCGIVAAGMER
ncbi:threonine transporter [Hahella sp. CCB-MM4]|uniref:LysE family translocator n=1 Tax=Hahella sp. (strain CCB-MM4) TaxID=1926491 RepID=UPI000B9C75B2|nr:LysE family translocator [Hahella sp. CCB-MM4]OZG74527.1 threonine transporter [Hahella sp. CCB-MM4]